MTTTKALEHKRILIVEDTRIGYDWARLLRAIGGADVDVVSSATNARRRLGLDTESLGVIPDMVLLDYQLTGPETGSALAAAMCKALHLRQVLRVSMSGKAREEVLRGYPAAIYHGYVGKLRILPELIHCLQRLFAEQEHRLAA